MDVTTAIITLVVGGCLTLVGSLIVFSLRSIKKYICKQDDKIDRTDGKIDVVAGTVRDMQVHVAECKVDCEREFVSQQTFLRETGHARNSMDIVTTSLGRLEGQLGVIENVPRIVGEVVREVVKEVKNGGPSNG